MDAQYDLEEIDKRLTHYSYVCGYMPSKFDIELSYKLGSNFDVNKYVHIKRWWYHMRSFSEYEISLFPATPPPNNVLSKGYKNIEEKSNINIDEQVCETLAIKVDVFFCLT